MNIPAKFVTTAAISIMLILSFSVLGQEAPNPWIPFTARMVERYYITSMGEPPTKLEFSGYFARDSRGSTYLRRSFKKSTSHLPMVGPKDTVILSDRPNRLAYFIDLDQKTVRKEHEATSNWEADPLSRGRFAKARAGEESLGKQVISGVECEGYRAPVPKFKKHFTETWYAPSLNFLPVKMSGYTLDKDTVESVLENIQVGPPDPSLFRPPQGFREVFQ